jgi:hypothetical protein
MQRVPCWLCGKPLELRITKGGKLYVVCDPCGLQCFIRRQEGMERLKKLLKHLEKRNYPFEQHSETLLAIQAILGEIDGLRGEIKTLEDKTGFLFPDQDLVQARVALEKRVKLLLAKLERLAQSSERKE